MDRESQLEDQVTRGYILKLVSLIGCVKQVHAVGYLHISISVSMICTGLLEAVFGC